MYRVTNRVTRSSFVVSHMYDMGPMTNYPRKGRCVMCCERTDSHVGP
jgi:hypothetical protein